MQIDYSELGNIIAKSIQSMLEKSNNDEVEIVEADSISNNEEISVEEEVVESSSDNTLENIDTVGGTERNSDLTDIVPTELDSPDITILETPTDFSGAQIADVDVGILGTVNNADDVLVKTGSEITPKVDTVGDYVKQLQSLTDIVNSLVIKVNRIESAITIINDEVDVISNVDSVINQYQNAITNVAKLL
jgi:hypothetical protein